MITNEVKANHAWVSTEKGKNISLLLPVVIQEDNIPSRGKGIFWMFYTQISIFHKKMIIILDFLHSA